MKTERIEFYCYGHENVLGTHKTTLEITKDKELSLRGDCIIGVGADFDSEELKRFANENGKGRMVLEVENIVETVDFEINSEFCDEEEIVIRLGEHKSDRTLGINADKSAKMLSRKMIEPMKKPEQRMVIKLEKTTQ